MPERHVFEVSRDGAAHATGTTAAPEPSRAIARLDAAPPAVEAPPPSLSAPVEEPKPTKPARRRRGSRTEPQTAGELGGSASALALPIPEAKPRRTRKKSAEPKKPARKKASTATSSRKKS